MNLPELAFASPRKLPRGHTLKGRIVVLDIAFAADGMGKGFRKITGRFLQEVGDRLARWVDHHDSDRHAEYRDDPRFVLHTKAEHGACPEIITKKMVEETGPVDTILCHFDLDGLYSAAKWILGGVEPYPGADDDARAVDTRIGEMSATANLIDQALRSKYSDDTVKQRIVRYLVGGCKPGLELDTIERASADFAELVAGAKKIARAYQVADGVAVVEVPRAGGRFDKTELLLLGQQLATVAVVIDNMNVSIAAGFDSGLNFVELFELGGGMPTRVNIPRKQLAAALPRIKRAVANLR